MNVFILNSGRCGSTTFIKACQHIDNYTASHESRIGIPGSARLEYPDQHIEADNRLSWFLGRLDREYGDNAFYVHLQREAEATRQSFARRSQYGIMRAYREGIYLLDNPADDEAMARGQIFVDCRDGMKGSGELSRPVAAGVIGWDDVGADLYQLCQGAHPGRQSDSEITVFKNVGGGHLDLFAAVALSERLP